MKLHFSFAWLKSIGAVVIPLLMVLALFLFLVKDAGLDQDANTAGQSDVPTETTMPSVGTTQITTAGPAQETTLSSASSIEPTGDTSAVSAEDTEEVWAEMWVDGKRVPMTSAQIAEFEDRLYQCKTQTEYEAMMETLACYNKGVDLSRFSWYWNDLQDLYSDEQIAMMQSGLSQEKEVPNVVGLEVKEAYRVMIDCGMIARFGYYYQSESDLPVGYCYYQDIPAGEMFNCLACIMVNVQAPREMYGDAVNWDPDDWDFDINEVVADTRENG